MAPTSRPRVGWAAISTCGSLGHLARDHELLLVAARQRRGGRVAAPPPRTSYSSSRPLGARAHPARRQQAAAREARAAVLAQREVLGEREVEHEAAAVAVLGDVADAGRRALPRTPAPRDVPAVDADRPAAPGAQAGDRLDQLALAVVVDAGDAPRSRRRAPSRTSPRTAGRPRSSRRRGRATSSSGSPAARRALLDAEEHVAADHQPGEAAPPCALGLDRLDLAPAAQHGHAVGDLEDLGELVGDEDDRRALRLQRAQDAEELPRLLRGEHGGRLVEDEDARVAVQRAQDLHALLLRRRRGPPPAPRGPRRGRSAPRARAPAPRRP